MAPPWCMIAEWGHRLLGIGSQKLLHVFSRLLGLRTLLSLSMSRAVDRFRVSWNSGLSP